jgi:hypothetical protein
MSPAPSVPSRRPAPTTPASPSCSPHTATAPARPRPAPTSPPVRPR